MEEASTRSSSEVRVVFFAIIVMVLGVGGLIYWQLTARISETELVEMPGTGSTFGESTILAPIVKRISDGEGARAKLMMEIESLRAWIEKAQKETVASESSYGKILDEFELDSAGAGAELKREVKSLIQANASMQVQIKELRIRNDSLEIQMEDLYDAAEEAVELAEVVVAEPNVVASVTIDEPEIKAPFARDPNEVDAKVLRDVRVVDANEGLDYVVLDVGEADGVRPQMVFSVLNGEKVTATLRAIDVKPDLTGAVVENLVGDDGVFPQTGDRAILGSAVN